MTYQRICHWAITGRFPYDNEDTAFVTPVPCTRDQAISAFCQWMVDEVTKHTTEQELRELIDADVSSPLVDCLRIVSVFCSGSQIEHA